MIIDKHTIDYYGEASGEFPNREMDDYDLMGQEIADWLRLVMRNTPNRYVVVEVKE